MLIKCPECNLQVSDKAFSCPHCGYPFEKVVKPTIRKSTKKKRLPNGFGQITEIKNRNLRKPFRAMVTIGFNDKGKPICKLLKPDSYFKTYNEAYEALMLYNQNPFDLRTKISLNEVFEKWFDDYIDHTRPYSAYRHIVYLWKKFEPFHNRNIKDIKSLELKEFIENLDASANCKDKLKSTLNMVYDYAVQCDYVQKNISRQFKLSRSIMVEKNLRLEHHIDFTRLEVEILWKNINVDYIMPMIMVQMYMGWRPLEICNLKTEDVDLETGIIKGGMKTKAGTGRIVPIHSRIRKFIEDQYKVATELNSPWLFNYPETSRRHSDIHYSYDIYKRKFHQIMKMLNLNPDHKPHDPRVHFITQCKSNNVDEYAIKYMVGHAISDITESVYTKRTIDWLKEEIKKIP